MTNEQPTTKSSNSGRPYRFWPIYSMAFARCFGYTIYNLALPNYLIYFQHISTSLIGIIISSWALAFILGPIAALPITKRFGTKKTVNISNFGAVILIGLQLLFFDPVVLIILRSIDGFIAGLFWPNLQMEVSNWQENSPKAYSDGYFKTYGLSWNTGILISQIVGYLIVLFGHGNEYRALIISWFFLLSLIPLSLSMEKSGTKLIFHGSKGMVADAAELKEQKEIKSIAQSKAELTKDQQILLAFPAIFFLLGTMIYAFMKQFYPLVVPLFYSTQSVPSYWVYLITFFHQAAQLIAASIWSTKSTKSAYIAFIFALGISMVFALWQFLGISVILLSIAFIINGFLSGLMYNLTGKIMLQYGATSKSLKYVTLYEFCNGIGFGLSPLMIGLIAEKDYLMNYLVLFILLIIFSGILLLLSMKAMKMMEKP